jgi:hypothetical protein
LALPLEGDFSGSLPAENRQIFIIFKKGKINSSIKPLSYPQTSALATGLLLL